MDRTGNIDLFSFTQSDGTLWQAFLGQMGTADREQARVDLNGSTGYDGTDVLCDRI